MENYSLVFDDQNTPPRTQICLFNNNYFVFAAIADQIRQNVQETEESSPPNTSLNASTAIGCGLEIYKLTPEGFVFVTGGNVDSIGKTERNIVSTHSSEKKIRLIDLHDVTPDSEVEMRSFISEETISETTTPEMVSHYKKEVYSDPESAESKAVSGIENEVISKITTPEIISNYNNEINYVPTEAESIKAKDVSEEKYEVTESLTVSQIHEPTLGRWSEINGQCALMTNDGNIKVIPENIMNLMEKFVVASNNRILDDPNEVYEHVKTIIFADLVNNKIVRDESTSVNSTDLSFLFKSHSDLEVLNDVSQPQNLRKPQPLVTTERKKGDKDDVQEVSSEESLLEEHESMQEEANQTEMKDSVMSDDWTNDSNQWKYMDKQDKENLSLQNLYETENEKNDQTEGKGSFQLEEESADELINSDDELPAYITDRISQEVSSEESLEETSIQEELADELINSDDELPAYITDKIRQEVSSKESLDETSIQEELPGELINSEDELLAYITDRISQEVSSEESLDETSIQEEYCEEDELSDEEQLSDESIFENIEQETFRGKLSEEERVSSKIKAKKIEETYPQLTAEERLEILEILGMVEAEHGIDRKGTENTFNVDKGEVNSFERISHEMDFLQNEHLERNTQPDLESPQISDSILLRKKGDAQTSLLKDISELEPRYVKEVKESKPKSNQKSFSKIKQLFSKKKQQKMLPSVGKENAREMQVIMTPNVYEDRPSFPGLIHGKHIGSDLLFAKSVKGAERGELTDRRMIDEPERTPEIIYDEEAMRKEPGKSKYFSKIKNIFHKKPHTVIPSDNKKKPAEVLDIMIPRSYAGRLSSDAYGEKLVEEEPDSGKHRVRFYSSDEKLDTLVIPEEIIASRGTAKERHASLGVSVGTTQGDISAVRPTEIGYCLRRGFRPDNLSLNGEISFLKKKETYSEDGTQIFFSERQSPMDLLLAMGYSVDDATSYVINDEFNAALKAAIVEARIWVNFISKSQGTLLILLASKAKPKIWRYYLLLVEAIVNNRINNAVKLDGFLEVLEKLEDGKISLNSVFVLNKLDEDVDEGNIKTRELKESFLNIYTMALKEATENGETSLSENAINLLHILIINYKGASQPHLPLLLQLIGKNVLTTRIQLESAIFYLSTLDPQDVKMEEFEKFCGLVKS